jgi:hypothetical protein
MRQQLLSRCGIWRILATTKHDIPSNSEGQCVNPTCRIRSPRVSMKPHPPEIVSEARLEERALGRAKGLATTS